VEREREREVQELKKPAKAKLEQMFVKEKRQFFV